MKKLWFVVIIMLFCVSSRAQQTAYSNQVYQSYIKSVEFYNAAKAQSFPVINLNSTDQLLLAFDDLRAGTFYYNYTIVHCDADWNPSQLSPAEYLQSFTDDRINNYKYSTNTRQKYTHYEFKFPNRNIIPKLSGNYLLKVYLDGDANNPVLTRRFYVVDGKVAIAASVVSSNNNTLLTSNQKINFEVNYGTLQVQNPNTDVRVLIMQNARPDKVVMNTTPYNFRGSILYYTDLATNDFTGGNEFRHFDLRSLKLNSDRVGHIYRDTANTVMLLGDPNRNQPSYSFQYDNNGNFYILNQDGYDPRTDADYAHVYFSLAGNKTGGEGSAYVAGNFNSYILSDENKMLFDKVKGRFYTDLYLKQGVYDYQYIWVDNSTKTADDTTFEGTYFDTENDYQLLVYYRPPGARYEQLVGYRTINTTKK